jgi:phosphoribosylaminoimidazolecarboxamide formyltransferase / IMP cyclohydrolase
MAMIKRALISVSDKTGVIDFAKDLQPFNIHILSTGGTAKQLRESGLKIMDVSEYTGFPEMLDGRVKTLHPKIHGGLLGLRSNPEHVRIMKEHGIEGIDLIVVNLYPFKQTISKSGCTFDDAIENIDIGGPAMLRSAAKNFESVTVITDPSDYKIVIDEMKKSGGSVSRETNFRLAVKVFERTSEYDNMIADYLKSRLKT